MTLLQSIRLGWTFATEAMSLLVWSAGCNIDLGNLMVGRDRQG